MRSPKSPVALSEREREVLFLAAEGLTDKEIALRLEIRAKTVRTYWDRIRGKLSAASRTQALALALRSAYEELSDRENQLRTFVQFMPVAFFAFDDDLRILAANAEAKSLIGYTDEETLSTRGVYARVLPRSEKRVSTYREWVKRKGEFRNWEVPIVRKDGSTRIVSWSSCSRHHPIPGWRTWVVGADVTPFHQVEKTLELLLSSIDQPAWILDINLRTVRVNKAIAEYLEAPIESLMNRTLKDFIGARDVAEMKRVFAEGGRERFPFQLRTHDGKSRRTTLTVKSIRDSAGMEIGFLILVVSPT